MPIIFLTAADRDAQLALRGYAAGAVDYLTKPFDPWVLRAKVSVFVELWTKTRQLAAQARTWCGSATALGTSVDSALALLRADHPDIGAAITVLECAVGKFRTPVPRGMPGGGLSGEVRPATF